MPSSATARVALPHYHGNDAEWKRCAQSWMREAHQGHLSNTGTVTLNANSFTTNITDHRISVQSFVDFTPQTANAADEKASGGLYVSGLTNGLLTLTHSSSASTDRTFIYTIWG